MSPLLMSVDGVESVDVQRSRYGVWDIVSDEVTGRSALYHISYSFLGHYEVPLRGPWLMVIIGQSVRKRGHILQVEIGGI